MSFKPTKQQEEIYRVIGETDSHLIINAGAASAGFPASGLNADASLDANTNSYYRRVKVDNLM